MGRNDPCACGSGKRFKSCCGRLAQAPVPQPEWAALVALLNAGRFAHLEERARALLAAQPNAGFAWQLLAAALGGQGKDALPALEAAARCLPEDPVACLNLGNALGRRGRLEEAAACFGRALELRPDFAEAYHNLGDLQLELARYAEAAESCRRAIEIKPDYAEAHANLGKAQLRLGDADKSVESCRRAIEIRPQYAEAHNSLGNAWLYLARFEDAIAGFRRALAINPDFAEAHANLANALRSLGRLDEAVAEYRRALLAKPDFVAAYTELGTALRLQGRTVEAEAVCREALKIRPDSQTITVLAEARADAGRFIEAEELFAQALSMDPESVEALCGAVRVRRMTCADGGWLAAARRLAGSPLTPQREMLLCFGIGKYCDDVKDYTQAFSNYRRANELAKLRGPGHDRTHLERMIDLVIRSHDRTWVGRQRSCGDDSTRPVFIVGMLRSGTSLAEQILASHPQVVGAGELMFWGARLAAATARAGAAGAREIPGDDGLAAASADYLALLRQASADAARVVDKMPTNFLSLGLIHAALPRARIIHMRRDPLDTCLSIYFQHFEAANTYANDLEDLAHYYREYRRLMRHWRATLPEGAMLDVPYEGLTEDLEGWTRRMLEFIEVSWDPRCLDFHSTARTVVTASKWQVRQPIDRRIVQRWRNYENFIQPLLPLMRSESE